VYVRKAQRTTNPLFRPETETAAWLTLTPAQRFRQCGRLLEFYLAAGGSLAPEKDSQSPFDFPEYYEQPK
jgi:hypothetical protein